MTSNFDAENAKKLIMDDDNINITEANPLKDLFQVIINLVLLIVSLYFFIYIISGAVLISLSPERQIAVEKFISPKICEKTELLTDKEIQKINAVKARILEVDKKFPKTSNLEINVIKENQLNALCYPNGNIYITSELYKYLDTDEKLTFVIAHEMAHYRHKDHLLNLRRNISNSIVLIVLAVANPNSNDINHLVESGLNITDLKYSRRAEANADKYAVNIMNIVYENAKAGVEVMNILKDKNRFDIEFLSSHPNLENRIKYIEKFSH